VRGYASGGWGEARGAARPVDGVLWNAAAAARRCSPSCLIEVGNELMSFIDEWRRRHRPLSLLLPPLSLTHDQFHFHAPPANTECGTAVPKNHSIYS